jgi:hypothetical protein
MKPIPILTEPTSRYFIFPNGQIADVYALRYDAKVDLDNMMFISIAEREEYKNSTLPTINDLFYKGFMSEGTCIEREYKIFLPHKQSLSEQDFKDIKKEFAENGFNVTIHALKHNYMAWLCDMKSGYRDFKRNYHLFTPCGCNPLSFRASTLHHQCNDWQQTYEC